MPGEQHARYGAVTNVIFPSSRNFYSVSWFLLGGVIFGSDRDRVGCGEAGEDSAQLY